MIFLRSILRVLSKTLKVAVPFIGFSFVYFWITKDYFIPTYLKDVVVTSISIPDEVLFMRRSVDRKIASLNLLLDQLKLCTPEGSQSASSYIMDLHNQFKAKSLEIAEYHDHMTKAQVERVNEITKDFYFFIRPLYCVFTPLGIGGITISVLVAMLWLTY